MAPDWQTQFTEAAFARVDAFTADHPEISRDRVPQPGQGATNRVIFARRGGRRGDSRGDSRLVFKVFCTPERKARETFGLRHWAETGLVPRLLYDVDDRMIVTSHIPGDYLHESWQTEGEAAWHAACAATGRAIATLARVPLSDTDRIGFEARFYEGLGPLEAYLSRILDLGHRIASRDPDFRDCFWKDSLDFIEQQLDAILSQPRVLYHQDAANLHVQGGSFMGCFDLEMCRVGCDAMQLGAASGVFLGHPEGWRAFRQGWEAANDAPLSLQECHAAAAAGHLLAWREISRYLSYDGTPDSGYDWADPADRERYRRVIETVDAMLDVKNH